MSQLQEVFVSLVINKHNIQTMHWNNYGLDFDPTHEKLDEYIDKLEEYIDEVAEMLKMCNERTLSLSNCIKVADESSIIFLVLDDDKLFNTSDVWVNCKRIFDNLLTVYENIVKCERYPSDIVSELEDHLYWIRKENKFKLEQRIKNSFTPEATYQSPETNEPIEDEDEDMYEVEDDQQVLHSDEVDDED